MSEDLNGIALKAFSFGKDLYKKRSDHFLRDAWLFNFLQGKDFQCRYLHLFLIVLEFVLF